MNVALAMLMCFVCVGSASVSHDVVNELQAELQALLDTLAQQSGFAIQLGVKTPDYEFSIASGSATIPGKQAKQITVNDTMAFGSATKPYTATAAMQLVEKGVLSLDDPAMKHIDPILQKLNGTTLVKLFGTEAAQITVGHVLQMRSGIADFDVPEFDYKVLADNASNPLELILYAAGLTPKFVCKPGTCVCYSSTNYELAGLILLAHAAKGEDTWQTFDQSVVFPSKLKSEFAHTFFENNGLISDHLTVPGTTR
jgi:CubicO group peptidase (beta-lactamase class C family)